MNALQKKHASLRHSEYAKFITIMFIISIYKFNIYISKSSLQAGT